MGIRRKLLSNTVYIFLDLFFASLLGFAYWFIVGRLLDPTQVGIISTSINLALFISTISLIGFQTTLPKLIPEYIARKQHGKIVGLNRFSIKVIILTNVLIIFILLLLLPLVSTFVKLPNNALILSIVILLSTTFSGFFGAVMYGFQDMKKFFKTDFIGSFMKLIFTATLLFLGFNYLGPLIGTLTGLIILNLLRFEKSWFFSSSTDIDGRRILFAFAFPAFITTITSLIFSNFQILLLSVLTAQSITGLFSIAFLITSLIAVIPNVLSQSLFPITSLLSVGKKIGKQSYLLKLVLRYAIFLGMPSAMILIFLAKPVLLLFRPEYLEAATFFPILTLASFAFGLAQLLLSNIYAVGKTKLFRNLWIVISIVFLILAPVLIWYYSALGLSIAYLISSVISLILGYHFIRKILRFRMDLLELSKIIFSSVVFLALLLITDILQINIAIKILFLLLSGFVYLLLLIPLRFYKSEDARILAIISEKSPFLKKQILELSEYLSKQS